MKYKLIEGSLNDITRSKETVLKNRGIDNIKKYLNLDDSVLYSYKLLEKIELAVELLLKHISSKSKIFIIVDSDCDGYTSASILYQYLKLIEPNIDLTYSIHTGKQHGLSKDIEIPEGTNLVLIPDAGTNDHYKLKELYDKGIDVIILDHHIGENGMIYEPDYNYAIIVNNQMCDYPNKQLSGVGVVYKFLQALDEETWNDFADKFLDLVALGLIGDVMDIRSYETKRLINKGLQKIRNKFFRALIKKQEYSINNNVTITNIQFYIVPLINGLIRAGDYDEKELMFRAFIQTDEVFKYQPRRKSKNDPKPDEIDEDIYTRVARLCANAKQKQNKNNDKDLVNIYKHIKEKKFDQNKIILANITNMLDDNLIGISAMKIAEKFNKPCLLLRVSEDSTKDQIVYSGSGRNFNNSPVPDLKEFLEQIQLFEYLKGHGNAFGCSIKRENILPAIELINKKLEDVDFTKYYEVDFIIDIDDLSIGLIKQLDDLKYIYGQGIKEANLVIKNVVLNKEFVLVMGKNSDTIKYVYNEEISLIKFKCYENDKIIKWMNDWENNQTNLSIDLIGKCSINNFNGFLTPQVIIENYEISKKG